MTITKTYPITNATPTFAELVDHLHEYLSREPDMETQLVKLENGTCVIQSRATDRIFSMITGMDKAVTIILVDGQGIVDVTMGNAKWLDKGVALTIAWFFCWLAAVTTAIGIYSQRRIFRRLEKEMDTFMGNVPETEKETA